MDIENKYKPIPFWSWNDDLDEKELQNQIQWMFDRGIGGFFMHARGGLTTPYLGEKWFSCVKACIEKAEELNMEAYAYDENGWPSGFAGGKLLEDLNNRDCYLSYSYGPYDSNALVSYDYSENKLKRVCKGEKCLNVYKHISTSTADVCDKEVVKKFINLTHEKYKEIDKNHTLKGFFTDEPQYYRWGTAFTKVMAKYYKDKYNEDLLDCLGLLFIEKEGYREFRYRYWLGMQDLLLNAFSKQIYDWCDSNGYIFTGHYVEETSFAMQIESCAGVMAFYQYEHIPGIDWLGRNIADSLLSPKQVGSVAAQLGKKQVLAESFACVGWDATPIELKHIAEYMMVGGINLLCQHLLPYSEHGQRKRDYPLHYSPVNPWVNEHFKEFNDYFSKLGKTLSNSKEIINVGIISPLRSCYFDFKRDNPDCYGTKQVDFDFVKSLNLLDDNHIPYHILDETIMESHAFVKDNSIVVELMKYDFVILPISIYTLGSYTYHLLKKYVYNGGHILLLGNKPQYIEGHLGDYSFLNNNVTLEEIISYQDFKMSFNKDIRVSYREDDSGKRFFFMVNLSNKESDISVDSKRFSSLLHNNKVIKTDLHFDRYESKLVYESNLKPQEDLNLLPLTIKGPFVLEKPVDNYLVLDKVSYSTDGINYSKQKVYMNIFTDLLKQRYQGELFIKYNFEVVDTPKEIECIIENTNLLEFTINGIKLESNTYDKVEKLFSYKIASFVKNGHNEIIAKINFFENENVYYALFGENVQESIKNCLVYDTTIEAIYLKGIFGVSGDFTNGKNNNCLLGNNFAIIKQNSQFSNLILDGFPFLKGNINYTTEIELNNNKYYLLLDKRFQFLEIYINNRHVVKNFFDCKIDVSQYLNKGKNVIKIIQTISNRNYYGPFHFDEEEPLFVGPFTFERFDALLAKNEINPYKDSYSFVIPDCFND